MKPILSLLCLVAVAGAIPKPCVDSAHNPWCEEQDSQSQRQFGYDQFMGIQPQWSAPNHPDWTEEEIRDKLQNILLAVVGSKHQQQQGQDSWPDEWSTGQQGYPKYGQDSWSDEWSTGPQDQQQNDQDSWSDEWSTGQQDQQQTGPASWYDEWSTGQQDQQQNDQDSWSGEWSTGPQDHPDEQHSWSDEWSTGQQDQQQTGPASWYDEWSTGPQDQQQNDQDSWSDGWTTGQQDQQQTGPASWYDEWSTGPAAYPKEPWSQNGKDSWSDESQKDYPNGQEWWLPTGQQGQQQNDWDQENPAETSQHQNHPNWSESDLDDLNEWVNVNMPDTQEETWTKG